MGRIKGNLEKSENTHNNKNSYKNDPRAFSYNNIHNDYCQSEDQFRFS